MQRRYHGLLGKIVVLTMAVLISHCGKPDSDSDEGRGPESESPGSAPSPDQSGPGRSTGTPGTSRPGNPPVPPDETPTEPPATRDGWDCVAEGSNSGNVGRVSVLSERNGPGYFGEVVVTDNGETKQKFKDVPMNRNPEIAAMEYAVFRGEATNDDGKFDLVLKVLGTNQAGRDGAFTEVFTPADNRPLLKLKCMTNPSSCRIEAKLSCLPTSVP